MGSKWADLGSKRADFGSKRANMGPETALCNGSAECPYNKFLLILQNFVPTMAIIHRKYAVGYTVEQC